LLIIKEPSLNVSEGKLKIVWVSRLLAITLSPYLKKEYKRNLAPSLYQNFILQIIYLVKSH